MEYFYTRIKHIVESSRKKETYTSLHHWKLNSPADVKMASYEMHCCVTE
jgi:hypothetical protein